MGQWISTDSEAIAGYRYDKQRHVLRIRFTSGGEYEYLKAPEPLAARFEKAASKGAFFAAHIRDKLAFRKVK